MLKQRGADVIETDRGGVGYGYLWWVGLNGRHFRITFPGKVVSARGHWGQYVVVDMAREIIVVHKVKSEVRPRKAVGTEIYLAQRHAAWVRAGEDGADATVRVLVEKLLED